MLKVDFHVEFNRKGYIESIDKSCNVVSRTVCSGCNFIDWCERMMKLLESR